MSQTFTCSECGGNSTDPHTCTECGVPLAANSGPAIGTAGSVTAAGSTVAVPDFCPQCTAKTDPDIRFCESCGFKFGANQAASTAVLDVLTGSAPAPAIAASAAPALPTVDAASVQLIAVVLVDPSLYTTPLRDAAQQEIPCPNPDVDIEAMARNFPLNSTSNLIGRGNPERRIIPEIWITTRDLGVSRVHAEVYLDGQTWRLRDLGSANGTLFHGKYVPIWKDCKWYRSESDGSLIVADDITCGIEVVPGMDIIVGSGWTRIRFEAR